MSKKDKKPIVVIVEDDSLLAQMYCERITRSGAKVYTALNADEFWRITHNHIPSVVLLDILLPGRNGLSILKEMRKHAKMRSSAVIFITNLSRIETDLTPELADVLGVSAYLVKSQTTPDDIVRAVWEAIDQS